MIGGPPSHVNVPSIGPATPGPMTPMTPASADPGIVPQLQWVPSLSFLWISYALIECINWNLCFKHCRNIVSTVNLSCRLELKKIALHARNAEYNPKRFAAVIMRIREPRTTALIFSSGKMVCTGAKSEEDSRLAARKYARIIQKLGFPVSHAFSFPSFVRWLKSSHVPCSFCQCVSV